jgi:hypothetical protein
MTYSTLEQALQTNHPAIIVSEKAYTYLGNDRVMMTVKKSRGKKLYFVVKYENGSFSTPVSK